MLAFEVSVAFAVLLCAFVTGLLFGFVVVVMPGIKVLTDRDFLRAFQVMDAVIQRRQPIFGLVWIGSVVAVVATLGLGFGRLQGLDRTILLVAAACYLLGTQLPTAVVNIPLNNEVQRLDLEAVGDDDCRAARGAFEARWNRWNTFRTVVGAIATGLLVLLLTRL